MKVYMLKDVEKVGMAGQVINVKDGFASNFLIPRQLAKKISPKELPFYAAKSEKITQEARVFNSKAAMLAERLRNIHLQLKKRTHDDGKLYGSVTNEEIVDLLRAKDVVINKKQVSFPKAIKATGEHTIVIKLTAKLMPTITLTVSSDGTASAKAA